MNTFHIIVAVLGVLLMLRAVAWAGIDTIHMLRKPNWETVGGILGDFIMMGIAGFMIWWGI